MADLQSYRWDVVRSLQQGYGVYDGNLVRWVWSRLLSGKVVGLTS